MSTTAKNLHYNPRNNPESQREFSYRDPALFSYRGVSIFWNALKDQRSFDYVYCGACLTQRHGFSSEEKAKAIIDALLDGTADFWISDKVLEHLKSNPAPRDSVI